MAFSGAQTRPQDSLNVVNFAGVGAPRKTPMPQPETYRYLFKLGLDTWEIARLFKVTEAEVYNFLAKDRGLK